MKIPTQKGEHPLKCTELSPKRKEGIIADMITPNTLPYSTFYYERKHVHFQHITERNT